MAVAVMLEVRDITRIAMLWPSISDCLAYTAINNAPFKEN